MTKWAFILVSAAAGLCSAAEPATRSADPNSKPIKVLILTGGHPYDAKTFDKAWGGHADIACEVYKDSKTPFSAFDDPNGFQHDVILMYTMLNGMTERQRAGLVTLLKRGVGLVVWHHALCGCQDWPEFERIAGCRFWMKDGVRADGTKVGRSGTGGGMFKMHVEDANHPITRGMEDFECPDESYNKQAFTKEITVLVTTDHPKSDKPIAWVSNYPPGARVFGFQSGHDAKTWATPGFRQLLANGIRWAAGRLGK